MCDVNDQGAIRARLPSAEKGGKALQLGSERVIFRTIRAIFLSDQIVIEAEQAHCGTEGQSNDMG